MENTGPNQRSAKVSAASTAKTNTGRAAVDSISQLTNGPCVRSMAPTAPRSEIIQKPSAYAIRTASDTTVNHGTAGRSGIAPLRSLTELPSLVFPITA
ncbi:hypothetical protein J1902_18365 [Arthrobacter sp. PO-11]|uniref:Uncharacterized protein n=1 Tax=Arthrobacter cavernae TaxID=2817681 RepID=A0A939HFD1_9MICC|nr:hypothetical protein [Arthrobacter cavernae]